MKKNTIFIKVFSHLILFAFFIAVFLTAFSFVRNIGKEWYGALAQEQNKKKHIQKPEQGAEEHGQVLAAFTAFIISPTPTPTHTPTPTATPTPTPTATPSPTPTNTPTPVPPTETPTPSPLPTRVPASPAELDDYFKRFAEEYGIEEEVLRKIAVCESGYNAQSANGEYGGMYQFHTQSWQSTRSAMGADPNPDLRFNPEEAIRTAAYKISAHGTAAWPACSK